MNVIFIIKILVFLYNTVLLVCVCVCVYFAEYVEYRTKLLSKFNLNLLKNLAKQQQQIPFQSN
jgi:hypothetical protein